MAPFFTAASPPSQPVASSSRLPPPPSQTTTTTAHHHHHHHHHQIDAPMHSPVSDTSSNVTPTDQHGSGSSHRRKPALHLGLPGSSSASASGAASSNATPITSPSVNLKGAPNARREPPTLPFNVPTPGISLAGMGFGFTPASAPGNAAQLSQRQGQGQRQRQGFDFGATSTSSGAPPLPVRQSDGNGGDRHGADGQAGGGYFASLHVPDPQSGTPGGVRIASPYALPSGGGGLDPLNSGGGASQSQAGAGGEPEPHPWAALFGGGGAPTTGARFGQPPLQTPFVPLTPAANESSAFRAPGSISLSIPTPANNVGKLNFPAGLAAKRSASGRQNSTMTLPTSAMTNADLARFKAIEPDALASMLFASPSSSSSSSQAGATPQLTDDVLILDIRPATSFSAARIRQSINICAPSTLLKRPGITVERIEEDMLGSARDRQRFTRWRNGPLKKDIGGKAAPSSSSSAAATTPDAQSQPGAINKIVVLDMDTSRMADAGKPYAGGGAACLVGMLCKFEAAGYAGELGWLVGGFNRFAGHEGARELVDRQPVQEDVAEEGTADENGAEEDEDGMQGVQSEDTTSQGSQPDQNTSSSSSSGRKGPIPALKLGASDFDGSRRASAPSPFTDLGGWGSVRRAGTGRISSLVQPRGLPMEAFSLRSTVAGSGSGSGGGSGLGAGLGLGSGLPTGNRSARMPGWGTGNRLEAMQTSQSESTLDVGALPGRDRVAMEGLAGSASSSACANPFFDNIRQNRELAHGITERIPLDLPSMSALQLSLLPAFLRRMVQKAPEERANVLAEAFFQIERDEQQRLIATMNQHAAESSVDPRSLSSSSNLMDISNGNRGAAAEDPNTQLSSVHAVPSMSAAQNGDAAHRFPFSIAAALERGAENRYNNIWTYEHSRVRLSAPKLAGDPGSDYLNGSHVEPAREFGSRRRYIATQAPLPSTFETFWTVVWEQNSRVIAMLTREHENGRLQSHPYWTQDEYGPNIHLERLEEVTLNGDGEPVEAQPDTADDGGGGMFPSMANDTDAGDGGSDSTSTRKKTPSMIRRTFMLSNKAQPEKPSRKVTQYQYIAWPDYHIPETPDSILNLMELADAAQCESDRDVQAEVEVEVETAKQNGSAGSDAGAGIGAGKGTGTGTGSGTGAGPMVVHCSAGVGRTGTFVVIDSILDVLRRERRRKRAQPDLGAVWDDGPESLPHRAHGDWGAERASRRDSGEGRRITRRDSVRSNTASVEGSNDAVSVSGSEGVDVSMNNMRFGTGTGAHADSNSNSPANASAAPSGQPPFRTPRKSLKRELSPSALMDLDGSSDAEGGSGGLGPGHGAGGGSMTSPPLMRRSRSRETTSDSGCGSVGVGVGVGLGPAGNNSPLNTPSRALDNLHLFPGKPGVGTPRSLGHGHGHAHGQAHASENGLWGPALPTWGSGSTAGSPAVGQGHEWPLSVNSNANPFLTNSNSNPNSSLNNSSPFAPTTHSPLALHSGSASWSGSGTSSSPAPAGRDNGPGPAPAPPSKPFENDVDRMDSAGSAEELGVADANANARASGNESGFAFGSAGFSGSFDFGKVAAAAAPAPSFGGAQSRSRIQARAQKPSFGSSASGSSSASASVSGASASASSPTPASYPEAEGQAEGTGEREGGLELELEKDGEGELQPDLIRRAVEVTREQRMSSVQTARQYVFVYSAVLAGVLRELKREGACA